MTVVLATVCQDGVVLGSDSQITDKGRGMTYPAEKLHPLGELAAWGGSGAAIGAARRRKLLQRAQRGHSGGTRHRRALQEQVLPILRHHYDTFHLRRAGREGGGSAICLRDGGGVARTESRGLSR